MPFVKIANIFYVILLTCSCCLLHKHLKIAALYGIINLNNCFAVGMSCVFSASYALHAKPFCEYHLFALYFIHAYSDIHIRKSFLRFAIASKTHKSIPPAEMLKYSSCERQGADHEESTDNRWNIFYRPRICHHSIAERL